MLASVTESKVNILWSRIILDEDDRYCAWPSVTTLRNGDVLVVCSGDRTGHISPDGKVRLIRSTDNGETWSDPVTIANGPIDDRDAGIVQLPSGEILVTWFTSVAYALDSNGKARPGEPIEELKRHIGYFAIRSTDNGYTWSPPERLENADQTPHGPVLAQDGSLILLGRGDDGGRNYAVGSGWYTRTIVTFSRSDDGGRTWKMLCDDVPQDPADSPVGFHEPNVVELNDGTLVGMARYESKDDGYMRSTFSYDGGRTWTPMRKTELFGHPPHMTALPDGRIFCVYAQRAGVPDRGEKLVFSYDGGQTWDVENEVILQPETLFDMGYPCTTRLQDGSFLTVFYGRAQAFRPDGKTPYMNRLRAVKWTLCP